MSIVLSLIKSIQAAYGDDNRPCKKTVQKLAYLIEEKNINLGLDYTIHFYGPYSEDLDLEIRYLNSRGDLQIDFENRSGHLLAVDKESYDAVELLNPEAQAVIGMFCSKKPSELELLATTLYVQREQGYTDINAIIEGVVNIKGAKYPRNKIESAIDELTQRDYFSVQK